MKNKLFILLFLTIGLAPNLLYSQFSQQGPKMTGSGNTGASQQGFSVAISSDGNTAVEGGLTDNGVSGAIWIFTRSGGVWIQQGTKLVGTGSVGDVYQGISVAISADGNTVIEGGYHDNGNIGAAWVFTRSGGVWTQQGPKLVGTGAIGSSFQGTSVSISADGNTAIVGGSGDNSSGAVWVFTRSGGFWSQMGSKLVGTGNVGVSQQGWASAISSDGNNIIVGGYNDNGNIGAAWIFTRSGNVWTQQGSKLVGTGFVGSSLQGYSVSISSDGNTVLIGGQGDNSSAGAFWVFTRSGTVWSQQGQKLVGTGAIGAAGQGRSVTISPDGNSVIEGGWGDNGNLGAVWFFTRTAGVWNQQGAKLVGTGGIGVVRLGTSVSVSNEGTLIAGGLADNNVIGAVWFFNNPTIGITLISTEIPSAFNLFQNYPNPFNPNSKIKFQIAKSGNVKFVVFDMLGREVETLVKENLNPGTYEVDFDGTKIASGIYFYSLTAGDYSVTKKMVLIK